MTIALASLFVILVCLAGFLLWKSRDTWRWYHITANAITLILGIAILFPTAGVLKSRSAWNKVKEDLDKRLDKVEAEQAVLKYGDTSDPVNGMGVLDLQSKLRGFALEAGRRWPNLRLQGNAGGAITLAQVAVQPALPPGVVADDPAAAAAGQPAAAQPAAPAAPPQPMIPQGLIVYGFAESPQPNTNLLVPTFFLGEFRVSASGPTQVTISPTGVLEAPQQQAISGGQAQSWTLYELLPLDGHEPFVAVGSEPADDALFGRVDDELVRGLLSKGVTEATLQDYLRDGSRSKPDDPPATRWVKIEFTKPHAIVVDSLEKRDVLDGGFFDGAGQAVDSRLQRGEDDAATFKPGDQIPVKEEAANELIDLGVAKLVDTYFVRQLHDYRFVIRRIRLRISELAIREKELEYEKTVLQGAIDATIVMLAANQEAKLKLENDVAKLQTERAAIKKYAANVADEVASTRERLVAIYRSNVELDNQLKELHSGIAAALP